MVVQLIFLQGKQSGCEVFVVVVVVFIQTENYLKGLCHGFSAFL